MKNSIYLKRIFYLIIALIMIAISCIGCGKKEHNESINDTEINKSSTPEEVKIIPDTEHTLKDNIEISDNMPWDETLFVGLGGNWIRLKFEKDVKIIIRTWDYGDISMVSDAYTHTNVYYDTESSEVVIPSYLDYMDSLEVEYFAFTWTPMLEFNRYKHAQPYLAITMLEDDNIVGAALIGTEEREDNDGEINKYVVLKNSVTFPKQNGEYQKVSGEYLNDYFGIKFDGFGDVKKEKLDKVKIPEENINVGNKVDYAVYNDHDDINSIHFSYNENTKMFVEVDGGKAYINELQYYDYLHERYECIAGDTMEFDFKEGMYVKFHSENPKKIVVADNCKNKSVDKRCETVYWDGFYDYIDENGNLKEGVDLSDKKHYMKVVIKEEDNIIGAALIKMEYKLIDGYWTASIHTEKSIEYPKENGEYQNITQEMVEEYFEAK